MDTNINNRDNKNGEKNQKNSLIKQIIIIEFLPTYDSIKSRKGTDYLPRKCPFSTNICI